MPTRCEGCGKFSAGPFTDGGGEFDSMRYETLWLGPCCGSATTEEGGTP